jgi:hypothetical protein
MTIHLNLNHAELCTDSQECGKAEPSSGLAGRDINIPALTQRNRDPSSQRRLQSTKPTIAVQLVSLWIPAQYNGTFSYLIGLDVDLDGSAGKLVSSKSTSGPSQYAYPRNIMGFPSLDLDAIRKQIVNFRSSSEPCFSGSFSRRSPPRHLVAITKGRRDGGAPGHPGIDASKMADMFR